MVLRYTVRADDPNDHRLGVTIDIDRNDRPHLDLVLPAWVPGSYHIQDPAKFVREFSAVRADTDAPLRVERREKARWRISTEGAPSVRAQYAVYAHQMITEGVDLTSDHLFLNAALGLAYVDGRQREPAELVLRIPHDWKVFTELRELDRDPPRYRATDYDELVDSPVDCGLPVVLRTNPLGIPHRIVLCGPGGNYEPHRLEEDLGRIVEATARLFGELPLDRYTFFYHLNDVSDGGLEHRASNSCVVPRNCFKPPADYRRFLSLSAHEYFHLFNVKRIRPTALREIDYTREVYTKLLWAMEGTTEYFSDLVLRRAELLTARQFLEWQAKRAGRFLEIPGRRVTSLEEASLIAWIDLYRPFENSPNQTVSYYVKGALVSLCLDLEIRHRSENRSSLEEVWRHLWREYGAKDRTIGEEDLLPIVNRVTNLDLAAFFERFVSGTDEVDFDRFAGYAGLRFGPKKPSREEDEEGEPGYLGLRHENAHGWVRVTGTLAGGPAERQGIYPGDELVALDRSKVTHEDFGRLLRRFPPGSRVELTVFRRGMLRTVPLTLGKAPPEKYTFTPAESPTALDRAVYERWLGSPWEPASAAGGRDGEPAAAAPPEPKGPP